MRTAKLAVTAERACGLSCDSGAGSWQAVMNAFYAPISTIAGASARAPIPRFAPLGYGAEPICDPAADLSLRAERQQIDLSSGNIQC